MCGDFFASKMIPMKNLKQENTDTNSRMLKNHTQNFPSWLLLSRLPSENGDDENVSQIQNCQNFQKIFKNSKNYYTERD